MAETTTTRFYKIDFMGKRGIAVAVSALLSIIAIVSLAWQGLNFAIDFTGGTVVEVGYPNPVNLEEVRAQLEKAGFSNPTAQNFGTTREVLIRLAPQDGMSNADLRGKVISALSSDASIPVELHRIEFVGPQVGDDLAEGAVIAMLLAAVGILIYVAWRFEYRFSFGALLATMHDIIMILGVFSILRLDFDLSVLAAVLAIMGYSLNDTIVVFDRIRENFRKIRRAETIEVINISINETLSRTLMTSFLTLLTAMAMAIWGGEIIRNFALALIIGIVVGTYSSIYVASALAFKLGISRADLLLPEKEGSAPDNHP